MELSNQLLSSITIFNKYAKYLPEKQRRETWDEICDRYQNMMIEKYPDLKEAILNNMKYVYNKQVLPSMRAMQFAGPAIKKNNSRLYNCAYLPLDHYQSFAEVMFLLLGGTGVGYSVQNHHIEKLPEILKPTKQKKYLVSDSLEGWADAIKILMKSYFGLTKYKPRFDFSDIRPKGQRLITAGGKAPGPGPLKECIVKIENILESKNNGDKLTPLNCHDICCHIANSVLSGGIRRSAMISLFDFDDYEMLECKYGNWWETNEQRGRANNSAVIVRSKIQKQQFDDIWKKIELSNAGEPGLYFTNDKDYGTNPCCFTGDMRLLTDEGYKTFRSLNGEEGLAFNYKGQLVPFKVWSNGVKNIIELSCYGKKIKCTADHRFMTIDGETVEAKDLVGKRIMPYIELNQEVSEYTKYGFIQGDGSLGRLSSERHKGMEVYFGEKDGDVAELFNSSIGKQYLNGYNEILEALEFSSEQLPYRKLPSSIYNWDSKNVDQFLKGLYSANGSIIKGQRIALKSTCKALIEQVQGLLEGDGIDCYITTNKEKQVTFSNGNYTCKESYDLNISKYESVLLFAKKIGFIHTYKQEALIELIKCKAPKVLSIKDVTAEEVFDFSLEDDTHWGIVEGIVAHNCEISLRPYQFCNLTEINVSDITTQEELNQRAGVAAFFGTLQAGFTDFHYLRNIWKTNTEKDALIGIGMTGIASGTALSLNLEDAASVAKTTNSAIAYAIGINPAARVTTVKPSGTTSCVLGTSSGIHAWHSEYYIRRIRVMKNDPLYTYLSIYHPNLIEDDKLRSHDTAVISIPQKAPNGSILRTESALDLLERVKKFNLEWVKAGHRKGPNTNNVSATISINKENKYPNKKKFDNMFKDQLLFGTSTIHSSEIQIDEWQKVGEWMWDNKDTFNGLSVLPYDGGTYVQAPFEDCTKEQYEELMKHLTEVDLTKVVELDDNTDLQGELACSGGNCEIK